MHFFNFDARLLVCFKVGSPVAVINFPLKRAHTTHVVPPGVFDSTGVVQTLPNKIAAYDLWATRMQQQYPNRNITILESVNALDLWELKSYPLYPLKYVIGTSPEERESYAVVFVPAFRHKQENREELNCKAYRLGTLLFGRSYVHRNDTSLDFVVYGYIFAVPVVLVRADSAEPFVFRVCRTARKLNRNSAKARLMESVRTMTMRPTRILTSNKQFLVTHHQTQGKFNLRMV